MKYLLGSSEDGVQVLFTVTTVVIGTRFHEKCVTCGNKQALNNICLVKNIQGSYHAGF